MNHPASEGAGLRKIVQVSTGPPLGRMLQRAALLGMLEGGEAGPDRWCLWLRSATGHRVPVIWPAGFRARLDPLEVLNPSGQAVARAGEHLVLGGGFRAVDPADPCSLGQDQAFYVQDEPTPTRAKSWREYLEAR
jgi:hypothetical protein